MTKTTYVDVDEVVSNPGKCAMGQNGLLETAGEIKMGFSGVSEADLSHVTAASGVPNKNLPSQGFEKLPEPPGV